METRIPTNDIKSRSDRVELPTVSLVSEGTAEARIKNNGANWPRIRPLFAVVLLVFGTGVTADAQTDACSTNSTNTACVHPGAGCDSGSGPGSGRCVFQSGDRRCDCVATKPLPSYTLSLPPLTPGAVAPTGAASAKVTVNPISGTLGSVSLSCLSITGGGDPKPTCQFNPSTVTPGSWQSELTVDTTAATPPGEYVVTVIASDRNGTGPDNGPQVADLDVQAAVAICDTAFPPTAQPPACMPVLETVLVPPLRGVTDRSRVTSVSWFGSVSIQPTDTAIFRVRAPAPTNLVVLINGQALTQIPPGGPPPQPGDAGYYSVAVQPMPGPPATAWSFWSVAIKLPKPFRFRNPNLSVPAFTITLRDISVDMQLTGNLKQAPDLNVPIAAYKACPRGCPGALGPPSEIFVTGNNSKNDADMPRARLGIVATDVTLAGWLVGTAGGDLDGTDEDWHFSLYLDPDFIERNYSADSLPFAGAILPGQPEHSGCYDYHQVVGGDYTCPCTFDIPGCVIRFSLTGGLTPDAGTFLTPGMAFMTVELNAWHINPRGTPPAGYHVESGNPIDSCYTDVANPNDAWALDPIHGTNFPLGAPLHKLCGGDYVIVTGTLWEDSDHDVLSDPHFAENGCFDRAYPAHGGWLEIHPVDVVRYVSPAPALKKIPFVVKSCAREPFQALTQGVIRPDQYYSPPPGPNATLHFQEIVDPRFTDPNLFNIQKNIQVDPCDPTQLTYSVLDDNAPNYRTYKSVVLFWWEDGDTPRPTPTCLDLNVFTNDAARFNLLIDDTVVVQNAGNGDGTGTRIVNPGTHTLGEVLQSGASLGDYKITFAGDCGAIKNISATEILVTLVPGEHRHCNILNVNRNVGSKAGCGLHQQCCESGPTKCSLCWPSGLACP